jgi:quercetin dioxygenase-like cupin family protein
MSRPWQPRPDRPEAGPLVHRRLAEEVARLQAEPAWREGDRNAITLTKGPGLRLVLTALRQGAALQEHRAPAAATLHVLSGRMVLRTAAGAARAGTGGVVMAVARPAGVLAAMTLLGALVWGWPSRCSALW